MYCRFCGDPIEDGKLCEECMDAIREVMGNTKRPSRKPVAPLEEVADEPAEEASVAE